MRRIYVLVAGLFTGLAGLVVVAASTARTVSASDAEGQVALDGVVASVNGRVITQSDVRQARLLKLVSDATNDDTTRRCLEDRLLILSEISRVGAGAPGPDGDLAGRRKSWEGKLGGANVSELLTRASMSDQGLDSWLRDDSRIDAYLTHQFGSLPVGQREKVTSDWLARLRNRAGLAQ